MNIVFLLKPKNTVEYIYEDNTLRKGLEKLLEHRYSAIPVITREGIYVGTVSEGDFLRYSVENKNGKLEHNIVRDIMRSGFNPAVKITAKMNDLLLNVMEQNFVPVVDDRNSFMGIITRKDVINYFYQKEQNN